jgi:hypothetical protein
MDIIRGEFIPHWADKVLYRLNRLYCDPNSIMDGEVVYCDTDRILDHKNILNTKKDLTIITHNSDHGLYDIKTNRINSININELTCWKRWFGQNSFSEKVIPLPIGFENLMWENKFGPKTDWLIQARSKNMIPSKTCYLNCNKNTALYDRQYCYNIASKIKNITIDNPNLTYLQYLERVKEHKFVLSPRGNGLDCHRTWEILMMKRVPIIKREGFIERLYENLPVLFVDDWEDLMSIDLDNLYEEYSFEDQDYLTVNFWKNKL